MNLEQLGPLQAVYIRGEPNKPCLVLCHGYGADAFDLASLVEALPLKGWNFVFPQGHLEVQLGPYMSGRAWFPIDLDRFEKSARLQEYDELMTSRPNGLDRASQHLNKLLAILPFAPDKIVLGGFSQGAMLSAEVALSKKESLHGLVLLSGALMCKSEWEQGAKNHPSLRYFQSHGVGDSVLPFATAQAMNDVLQNAGLAGDFVEFRGGHEIPPLVIQRLSSFLNSLQ